MELSERLIQLRKEAGLSQEKLAEMLNISRQAVSKWESGASSPDIHNIIQLGKLYNVSTDYILLEKTEDEKESAKDKPEQGKLQINGFIWLGLGVLSVLVLYFVTNGL